ncbi:MAG: hypothetical protein AAF623_21275 [Planctomycetota bacterium]
MDDVLYLDTARVGQMTPAVGRMLNGIVDLNHAIGSSLYFSDFLFGGYEALPPQYQLAGLNPWQGIEILKDSFSRFVFGHSNSSVLFSSRSSSVVLLASQMIFSRCRNVLVTDLNWPNYGRILESQIPNPSCNISRVSIERLVFDERLSAEELSDYLIETFLSLECDGIFVPAVCNRGVVLPLERLLKALDSKIRFSVIDAAQAINHVDLSWASGLADIIVGGTQKWMSAYVPLSVGLFNRESSREFIQDTLSRQLETQWQVDPLLRFTQRPKTCLETVNLNSLFTAAAALADASELTENFLPIDPGSLPPEWIKSCSSHPTLSSNIQLLDTGHSLSGVDRQLMDCGIAASELQPGLIRISAKSPLGDSEAARFIQCLELYS